MGKFGYHSIDELNQEITRQKINIAVSEDESVFFKPLIFGLGNSTITIPNRLAIHPMEGFDSTEIGDPTESTHTRYQRYGESGAGIVWFEATAVVPEGRSNPHQLILTEKNTTLFKDLISSFNSSRKQLLEQNTDLPKEVFQNPIKILQLTHSGRYSRSESTRHPLRATNSPKLDESMHINPKNGEIISDEYIDMLQEKYINAIVCAKKAGFDGVDIKSCHGYLISELLGAYTRSSSKHGGESIENRSRLLLNIIKEASQKFPDLVITSRINMFDPLPYPYGLCTKKINEQGIPTNIDLSDLHYVLNQMQSCGVRIVSFSAGNPYYAPYLSRPYSQNAFNGPEAPEHPLYSYERIIEILREIKTTHPNLITIGTALSWFRHYGSQLAAGEIKRNSFDIAGFGRMAFANPGFPIDIFRTGEMNSKKSCIACSKCTELMRMGSVTGCVIRNPNYSQIYREAYKKFQKENSKK